jgi:hypothetical protein
MGGESKRKQLLREAAGIPDEGFRVRIRSPSWFNKRQEKIARRGVVLPVAASTRNARRLGQKDAEGNPLPVPMPVKAEHAEQIFGPVREHNERVRRGEVPKAERLLEFTTTEEHDDGQPDAAEPEAQPEAAPGPT